MRQNRVIVRFLGIALVCLIMASTFGILPSTVKAAGRFNIGDTVEVTTNLNVRTGPGTGYPEITDPDYPGYAPKGTIGKILSGPSSADGYIWWRVDFGLGLYSGWSVEGGLKKVSQPPSPPTLVYPLKGATDEPLTPTFQWSSVSNADYYGLYISEPPYGPSHLVYDNDAVYGTSLILPSSILSPGVKYYWNMRSHNSAGWGGFSDSWYFTVKGTSIPCFGDQTCYSTKEEAVSHVPDHVVPRDCFVWNDGPPGYPWRPIPGTGCAHWVAHQLGIRRATTCYGGYSIRISDVIYGRTEVEINSCKVGDIWTNNDRTHCGIVRQLGNNEVLVEHDSSSQGGVVTSWFSSGKCWTEHPIITDQQKQQEILNMVNRHKGSLPVELVLAIIRQEGGKGALHVDGWNYNSFYRESEGPWAQPTNGYGIMQVEYEPLQTSGAYTNDQSGYDHSINDGCNYLLDNYSNYGSYVQATLHYNTGPNSLYIYLGKNWGDRNYPSHVAGHLSNFVPNTYGLLSPNLVDALNQGQNILNDYLYNKGIATGQSLDYYKPYQVQLDSDLHNIEHSMPDLIVENIWTDPSEFHPGDTVKIYTKIKNIGNGDAEGYYVSGYFDGSSFAGYGAPGLHAGSSYTLYWTPTWPSDTNWHTIKVVADAYGNVAESNKGNNERSEQFKATPRQYTLTINVSGQGTTDPSPGTYTYDGGTRVTITAIYDYGYKYYWSGDASGNFNPITITMDCDKSVTANFVKITYTLSTSVNPSGGGSVSPGGGKYNYGTDVTLTASPTPGYTFDHWEGDASGIGTSVTITMNSNKSVTAFFRVPEVADIFAVLDDYFKSEPSDLLGGNIPTIGDIFNLLDAYFSS